MAIGNNCKHVIENGVRQDYCRSSLLFNSRWRNTWKKNLQQELNFKGKNYNTNICTRYCSVVGEEARFGKDVRNGKLAPSEVQMKNMHKQK